MSIPLVFLLIFLLAAGQGFGQRLGQRVADISVEKLGAHRKKIFIFFKTLLFVTMYSLFWGTIVAGAGFLFLVSISKANAYASTITNPILKWTVDKAPFILLIIVYLITMTVWKMKYENKRKEEVRQ